MDVDNFLQSASEDEVLALSSNPSFVRGSECIGSGLRLTTSDLDNLASLDCTTLTSTFASGGSRGAVNYITELRYEPQFTRDE